MGQDKIEISALDCPVFAGRSSIAFFEFQLISPGLFGGWGSGVSRALLAFLSTLVGLACLGSFLATCRVFLLIGGTSRSLCEHGQRERAGNRNSEKHGKEFLHIDPSLH